MEDQRATWLIVKFLALLALHALLWLVALTVIIGGMYLFWSALDPV